MVTGSIRDCIVRIVMQLAQDGLVDTRELGEIMLSLGRRIFICGPYKLDYEAMERSIREGPILLECGRSRAYMAAKYLSQRLGKTVYRRRIGRRSMPVYVLYTEEQSGAVEDMLGGRLGKPEGSGEDS